MIRYKVVIIDDEPIAIKVLENHFSKIDAFIVNKTFTNVLEANLFLAQNEIDLLMLDIEMPGYNGVDFLKSLIRPPKVIFTTAHRNYAVDAFDLDVIDYLLKPISFDRFLKAINRFFKEEKRFESIAETPEQTISIKADKKTYKINVADIVYIEGLDDYLKIHLIKKNIVCYYRMHQIQELLPETFLRIHRSYIINKNFINAFTNSSVEIGEQKLPIGRTYRGKIKI